MGRGLFWGAVGLTVYTYVGFPLVALARGLLRPRPIYRADVRPKCSLIIAAYNEVETIGRKLENVLGLEYPRRGLEVIVASDGSDDGTNEVVAKYRAAGVKLLALPRVGKNRALNAAVEAARGEVLAFTDANSMFPPDALRKLVRPFADPSVGGVCGDQRYLKGNGSQAESLGERTYWKYDRLLKLAESSGERDRRNRGDLCDPARAVSTAADRGSRRLRRVGAGDRTGAAAGLRAGGGRVQLLRGAVRVAQGTAQPAGGAAGSAAGGKPVAVAPGDRVQAGGRGAGGHGMGLALSGGCCGRRRPGSVGASGRVFAAIKTSLDDLSNANPNAPLIMLLVRDIAGNWSNYSFGRIQDDHTRPIVLIDEEHSQLYMLATSPGNGGAIYYKTTPLSNIQFPTGQGTPFIQSSTDTDINDATSTKQNLNSATGLLVLAADDSTNYYLHNYLSLGGPILPTATATPTVAGAGTATATATATRTPTATGNATATPTPTTRVFTPVADAYVDSRYGTSNFGSATFLKVDGSPTEHAFLKFQLGGLRGTIVSARLRVYTTNPSVSGGSVARMGNPNWSESTVTYNTRPAIDGPILSTLGGSIRGSGTSSTLPAR